MINSMNNDKVPVNLSTENAHEYFINHRRDSLKDLFLNCLTDYYDGK